MGIRESTLLGLQRDLRANENRLEGKAFMGLWRHWILNVSANFDAGWFNPERKRDILQINPGKRRSRPVTILGAGPSLRADLQNVSADTTIVACDRILGFCLERGVVPDYVVTVDPQPVAKFYGPKVPSGIPLIAGIWAHPSTLAAWPGEVYFYGQRIQTPDMARDLGATREQQRALANVGHSETLHRNLMYVAGINGCLIQGGNVGATAVDFADAILLAHVQFWLGIDFSYGKEFYADKKYEQYRPTECVEAKSVGGQTVFTDEIFQGYAKALEQMIDVSTRVEKMNNYSPPRFYNCSATSIVEGPSIPLPLREAYRKESIGKPKGRANNG